jgi:hypothetical protein
LCLVTGENAEESGAALRDQVLRETRKAWFQNVAVLRPADGEAVWSSAQVLRWHKAFKDGTESGEDEERAGRPSTSRTETNVACVKAVLDRDRRLSVRLIAEEVGLPKMDVHRIITEDLHMRKICAKLVPKNLSEEQKDMSHIIRCEGIFGSA